MFLLLVYVLIACLCVFIACLCVVSARDEGRGQAAVAELQKEGLQPKFHQLDILSTDSINKLHAFLKGNYAGLDILVNNAGIAYKVRHGIQKDSILEGKCALSMKYFDGKREVVRRKAPATACQWLL